MDDYPEPLCRLAEPFLAGEAWSCFLSGTVGSWKTSFACALARAWTARHPPRPTPVKLGWNSLDYGLLPSEYANASPFIAPDVFTANARNMDASKWIMRAWREMPIAVFDDLGAFRNTPHLVETLVLILGARYNANRATIATSNCPLSEIAEFIDARIASRFQDGILIDTGKVDRRARL